MPLSRRLDRCDRVIQNESSDPNGGNVCQFSAAMCTSQCKITFLTRKSALIYTSESRQPHSRLQWRFCDNDLYLWDVCWFARVIRRTCVVDQLAGVQVVVVNQVAAVHVLDQATRAHVLDQVAGALVVDQVAEVQVLDQVAGNQVVVDQVAGVQVAVLAQLLDQVARVQVLDQVAGFQVIDQVAGVQVLDQVAGVQVLDQVAGVQVEVDQVTGVQVVGKWREFR